MSIAAQGPGQDRPATALDDRKAAIRHAILDGPVLRILLRLALPTIAVLVAQTLVGIIETYYVSRLGTDALVGVSVVFPVWMLMTMMSAGGIGGGVASAVARAIGADRHVDADDHVLHATMLGIVMGLLFMAAIWLWGPWLFEGLGARGGALAQAITYSRWLSRNPAPQPTYTEYGPPRAQEGADQLADYLDREVRHTASTATRGYLVVFDARRRNVQGAADPLVEADAMHFANDVLHYNPDHAQSRDDFAQPVRFFLNPRRSNFATV